MKKFFFYLVLFLLPFLSFSQTSVNMTAVGSWDVSTVNYNDIWGYVDGSGNEYALIGSHTHVHVINVTAATPVLVGSFAGGNSSLWRDIKTYGNYAYAVADQSGTTEGLMVIDLSNLPASVSLAGQYSTQFKRAHNIYIDVPNDRLYVAGSSGGTDSEFYGLMIYDLATTPANPTLLGTVQFPSATSGYIHDVYVKNNIAYCSHGNNGLYVHDLTDITNWTTLGGITPAMYPQGGYNHSGWLSADENWYVFADETHGKALKIADVSDLTNINVPSTNVFQNCLVANNTGCIPHNPFVLGNYVYVSYYHDGLKVYDMTNPASVSLVAWYDTYSGAGYSGYKGAWGVYPYLPSGKILISDISTGLHVVTLNSVLPIDLLDFRGKKNKLGAVELSWDTHAESNNDYFEIEKSSNGTSWETFEKVDGRGNANSLYNYKTEDASPFEERSFYRLKQVDFDGAFAYSDIISVETDVKSKLQITPSLFGSSQDEVSITFPKRSSNADWQINIYNSVGMLVRSMEVDGERSTTQMQVSDLPNDNYFLEAMSHGQVIQGRFLKN